MKYLVRTPDNRELVVDADELARRVSTTGDPVFKPNEITQVQCYDVVPTADGRLERGAQRSFLNVVIVRAIGPK